MKTNESVKHIRNRAARGMVVISLLAGISIGIAVQFCNGTTAVADEPLPAPPAAVQPAGQLPMEYPADIVAPSVPDTTPTPDTTPAPSPDMQNYESLARILLYEKRIAGGRISEAERREIAEQIVRYSRILNMPPELGAALIAKESRFNPRASSRGYKGLGQLGAAARRNNGVKNPFDIEQNVRATLSYLNQMMNIWEGRPDRIERALASYNSGAGAVRGSGPGISRKFINSVLKIQAEIQAIDIPPQFIEAMLGQPKAPPAE